MRRREFLGTAAALPAAAQALLEQTESMEIVSSHEHLLSEEERYALKPDVFTLLSHYAADDLRSAGMAGEPKRWEDIEPWWRHVRGTGYGQAVRIALRDIYGVEDLDAKSVEKANERIAEANRPGLYGRVLKRMARIRYAVLDDYWRGEPVRPDPRYFVLARKLDWFCSVRQAADVKRMEEVTGVEIHGVGDLKRAMEKRLEQSLAAGLVALKTTLAYSRPLEFAVVSEREAQADFELAVREPQEAPPRRLSDHMFHHALGLASERGLPVQVHTGTLAGNRGMIDHTRPGLLNPLFVRYPRVRFDLFHTGWPWTGEVAALAKMFPNVTADFCWMWVLSPAGARRALDEMLETAPANKILDFGGDYRYVELTYAHAKMARAGIAEVLAGKVARGWCTAAEAAEAARLLLEENAARLFPRKNV
jgi:predicted TIM-barrel fold metal-dependent hydrolase